MNKEIRDLFDKNNIVIQKITISGSVIIVSSVDNRYVIKKKDKRIKSLYKYLSSRNFNNYPKLIYETDNYDVFEYIDGASIPYEEEAVDIIKLVSSLHSKTTFYKDIDEDTYKEIYEDIIDRVNYLYNYYDDICNIIDREEYMSPSNYFFMRNVSMLFSCLNYCKEEINKWHDLIKDIKRIRVVNLHNNLSLDHYLLSSKPYLISWNKSKRDMPIYDLIVFYKKYYMEFDFCELIRVYESYYPLLKEERILLYCLLSIPDKINFDKSEYDNCLEVLNFYEYISSTNKLINDSIEEGKKE